ncbi:MAG: hypothetical protein PHV16_04090 [Candidatus Nanoarchaeia archaeon]|nr:hypothetical protein [Candidatus Nanoarchaeia archaeon]
MARKKTKKNRSGFWFVIAIAFLMLTSTIGYVFKGGSSYKYNGFSFSGSEDGRWIAKINGKNMIFYYHPENLENINISQDIINNLKNTNMVYFTYDINNTYREDIAAINLELSNILWNDFKIYSSNGLTSDNDFNIDIINCSNATKANPVIYYKKADNTSIDIQDYCIILNGRTGMEFMALKERLLYGLYGVIE